MNPKESYDKQCEASLRRTTDKILLHNANELWKFKDITVARVDFLGSLEEKKLDLSSVELAEAEDVRQLNENYKSTDAEPSQGIEIIDVPAEPEPQVPVPPPELRQTPVKSLLDKVLGKRKDA
jgi:hypothetical protein